jgi:serine/threonine-protein kinase
MREPRIPGYTIERLLGKGGTAEVYAAKRNKDFERVALKILRPDLSRDKVAANQFVKEAKLLQELDVPQVVNGMRVFRFMHTLILEMERVAGATLLDWLDQGRKFSEAEALDIVCEVAVALEGMREHGVIHRDLKPGNIMLDRDFTVRLIDLGFAGEGNSGGHGEGTTMGTAAYLAPEQAKGQSDLDGRADIYSLGVTLYQLVLGELPFVASDDKELLRMQVLDSLKGAAMKSGKVSPMVHYFLEKMMAKDRDVRYASAAELIEDLEAHLGD